MKIIRAFGVYLMKNFQNLTSFVRTASMAPQNPNCEDAEEPKPKIESLRISAYNASGFREYGLMRDDLLDDYFDDDVCEALRRLPADLYDERNYRLMRAYQLSINMEVLPKEEWTTLECDKLYLTPYVEEVRKERLEREEWDRNN